MKENILIKIFDSAYSLMLEENLVELTWESKSERIYIRRKRESSKNLPKIEKIGEKKVEEEEKEEKGRDFVRSPINGFFYRSPSPGAPPFVDVPCEVKKGQTLCIIEAMKVMNEIKAEKDMRILRVLVENGKEVKEGQELFEIE
ncbi:MAG: acetyl-CoA carboxylase, biotin carboxyl carrier protein [Caldiserica bacterium]|nr:MAG: acetyl-CoA carboxylase, biotin carboxyl carrier protein [Caldisericota bacterium]